MNLPSVKTLLNINGMDEERAKLLRKLLECDTRNQLEALFDKNRDAFRKSDEWWRMCFNEPSVLAIKLHAADELIEGFGVECCGKSENFRDGPPLEYINLGDTYDCTLCRFRGRYVVSSWGDIVERHERLFRDR